MIEIDEKLAKSNILSGLEKKLATYCCRAEKKN